MFETFIQVMSVCYLARKQADAGYLVTTLSLPSFPFPWVWNMMAVLCVVYVSAYTCVYVRVCVCACVRVYQIICAFSLPAIHTVFSRL